MSDDHLLYFLFFFNYIFIILLIQFNFSGIFNLQKRKNSIPKLIRQRFNYQKNKSPKDRQMNKGCKISSNIILTKGIVWLNLAWKIFFVLIVRY